MGHYHWEPSETSEIYISGENPIRASTIGQRPAIAVARGTAQFYSLGLDDMETYNFQTGQKRKSVLVPGTMAVHCCSRNDLECDRIAFVVAEQLWAHRELLMKAGFFEIGRQPVFGAPSPAGSIVQNDGGEEWYVTTVTCPWQFNRSVQVTPLGNRILQGIDLAIRAQMKTVEQQRTRECVPESPNGADYPYSVQGCPPAAFSPASDINGHTPNPGYDAPKLPVAPHPLNPAQTVRIRSSKPNCPAVKPPSMGGRPLPISTTSVEESCGNQMDPHVTSTSTVKV